MSILVKGLLLVLVVVGLGGLAWYGVSRGLIPSSVLPPLTTPVNKDDLAKLEKFSSETEFKDYLSKAPVIGYGRGFGGALAVPSFGTTEKSVPQAADNASQATVDRYSDTNVQVKGIDEPDIVKTDGREIYVSSPNFYSGEPRPLMGSQGISLPVPADERVAIPPRLTSGGVRAVKAWPVQNLKVDGTIGKSGDLLLSGNKLVVLSQQAPDRKIYVYDVSNPASPTEKWNYEIKDNNEIIASRLYQGKLYLVIRTQVNMATPCPVRPLAMGETAIVIPCTEIYHPVTVVPADATYTAMAINVDSGKIEKNTTFVGSTGQSVVYMSEKAIYISYYYPGDYVAYFSDFLKENSDLLPAEISQRLAKLSGYDISPAAKMTELTQVLSNYESSLDNDARLKLQNEMQNRLTEYGKKHSRDLGKTGIVKVAVNGLGIAASGTVPGQSLNQFSLDEFENNLRIATTIGQSFWGFGFGGGQSESANDVYVLDANLNVVGNIQDLGLTERIYSARFIGKLGYLVTFRQTDPFYVLDLSNPRAPKMTGELKIPGFSSYLHPLRDNQILGVGQENGKVKLSLFDVSNPSAPLELAKYNLDDYWSEVSSNHHAYQQDAKHQIFFIPGGKGGYIFSYQGNNLRLVKAVATAQARRAVYINDYLYVVSDTGITVLDETAWNTVKELSF